MKKVIVLLSSFMLYVAQDMQASFAAKRAAAFVGLSALNLAALGYRSKSVDFVDTAVATTSAALATNFVQYPPQTIQECKFNMGLQMGAAALLIARSWYKITQRQRRATPAPIGSAVPWTENIYG